MGGCPLGAVDMQFSVSTGANLTVQDPFWLGSFIQIIFAIFAG
jgi:hypothetical protein